MGRRGWNRSEGLRAKEKERRKLKVEKKKKGSKLEEGRGGNQGVASTKKEK